MAVRYEAPEHSQRFATDLGEIELWMVTPTCAMVVISGFVDELMAVEFVEHLDRLTAALPAFYVVTDAWDLVSYHPTLRTSVTDWIRTCTPRFRRNLLLTRSKVVQIGATIVNLVVAAPITVLTSIEAFERALPSVGVDAGALHRKA